MSWLGTQARGTTALDRVFGLRPNLYAAYREFAALFWQRSGLDPRLLELCRLLVAGIHGCRSELAVRYRPAREAGVDEALVAALPRWHEGPFDARERACLAFAEMFVRDPHAVGDADVAAVVAHLGEPGLVALVEALAVFDGFCRFRCVLGVEPDADGVVEAPAPRPGDASAH